MYQGNNTNNDNRRSYIIRNQYFTYQRTYNTIELEPMIQTLQQVNEMRIQMIWGRVHLMEMVVELVSHGI